MVRFRWFAIRFRWFAILAAAGVGLLESRPLMAQSPTGSQAELQNEIDQLKQKVEALEAANAQLQHLDQQVKIVDRKLDQQQSATREEALTRPVVNVGPDGFFIHSQDNNYDLRIGGCMQADGRFYLSEPKPTGSEFLIRRLRPYFEGTVAKYYDFRFMMDFGQGTTTLEDAYANIHYWQEFQLLVGKFREPVGLERLEEDRALKFVERALPSDLVPDRDLGFDIHGDLFAQRVDYALGFFNGTPDKTATDDSDNNDAKDFAGRIFVHPFADIWLEYVRQLGFGIAGTYGDERSTTIDSTYKSVGQNAFFTYAKGVIAAGPRYRYSPQFYYYWRSFGLLGEYVQNTQRLLLPSSKKAAHPEPISNQAWQLDATYLVTGEDATYGQVKPRRNFDPIGGGIGAWELAARIDQLLIDRDVYNYGFASPSTSALEAFEWTLGVNWYLNPNVKMQFDHAHTGFRYGAANGHDRPDESVLLSELQL
jgi:phosphate-selective porin OprO and OprP